MYNVYHKHLFVPFVVFDSIKLVNNNRGYTLWYTLYMSSNDFLTKALSILGSLIKDAVSDLFSPASSFYLLPAVGYLINTGISTIRSSDWLDRSASPKYQSNSEKLGKLLLHCFLLLQSVGTVVYTIISKLTT